MSIENRNITFFCPICGNNQFKSLDVEIDDLTDAPDDTRIQCADCNSIFSVTELIEDNQNIINANIEEIEQEFIKDFEKEIKKIFK